MRHSRIAVAETARDLTEDAAVEVQRQVRKIFVEAGRSAAQWLIERIGDEWSLEALTATSFLLAEIGLAALEPILAALENNPSEDVAEYLLRALRHFPQLEPGPAAERVAAVLRTYQEADQDPEIRAAAYRATKCLGPSAARALLEGAREKQHEAWVNRLVSQLLAED